MQNREILRQIVRLRSLVAKTREASDGNIELQAHWAKYLCVVSAGLLENTIQVLYSEYAERQVSRPVTNFVSKTLSQIRNPKAERFLETAQHFKSDWSDELGAFLEDNGRKEAINSIIGQRYLIAHGRESDSTITVAQISNYIEKAIEVIEKIEEQCLR